jgi:hypothetical protein
VDRQRGPNGRFCSSGGATSKIGGRELDGRTWDAYPVVEGLQPQAPGAPRATKPTKVGAIKPASEPMRGAKRARAGPRGWAQALVQPTLGELAAS